MSQKYRIIRWIAALGVIAAVSTVSAIAQPIPMKWTVAGTERHALVFAPSASAAGEKVPVVFAFHGHGGNVQGTSRSMAFQDRWPQALVVYMQGLPTTSKRDPQGKSPGWQHEAGELGDRDLKFFDAVLATLKEKYPVDEHRIYATGFSNGAFFTYLLWATRGSTFAAFAPCAGLIWPTLHLSEPKPLLQIDGENDKLVHFADATKTVETVRALDGATGTGEPCGNGCTRYPSTKKTPVVFIKHPGGHVFPRWASERIVEFFKNHPAS
jgi:polyhydroxybutyrate depolymerase